jgi:Spy/CpxP family protein refolding chaperone
VARTAAVDEALGDGRIVLVQATPVTQQTPPLVQRAASGTESDTKTQGNTPFTELGLTPEQEKALIDAGYADRKALADATDDDLIAVSTIGKATVANLRKALAEK